MALRLEKTIICEDEAGRWYEVEIHREVRRTRSLDGWHETLGLRKVVVVAPPPWRRLNAIEGRRARVGRMTPSPCPGRSGQRFRRRQGRLVLAHHDDIRAVLVRGAPRWHPVKFGPQAVGRQTSDPDVPNQP